MISRREFIHASVAGVALAAAGGAPLYKVIYDQRFAGSAAFAAAVRKLGFATHAIRGDITGLWFNDLDRHWRERRAPVAGLTTESALFCLERLAWDHQMRVAFRAEHPLPLASGPRLARALIVGRLPMASQVADGREFLVSWRIA
jgi:hypothetical protein